MSEYAYTAQFYIAFTLAVSSNYEIQYFGGLLIIKFLSSLSINAKKLAWYIFVYVKQRILKDEQQILPSISLLLGILLLFIQPFDPFQPPCIFL